MNVDTPILLKSALPPKHRLLGLDLGSKTIGLAISDGTCSIASPLLTIKRQKFTHDCQELLKLIEQEKIGGLVYGLPINMDGSLGPRCQSTKQFAKNFEAKTDPALPYCFWDERMTSQQVERMLVQQADLSRKRRGEVIDKLAATLILQGALDSF